MSETPYIRSLDGVRAASILLVLAAHTLPLNPIVGGTNEMAGKWGMALFFCLSGYLITSMLYRKQEIFPFLIKRVLRIVPAMWLYIAILAVVLGIPLSDFWANILFVANYFPANVQLVFSHLWSLCVEMQFYVAVALVVLIGGRRALWLIPPAALLVTGLRVEAGAYADIATHLRVDEILSGGCLALVNAHWGDRLRAALRPAAVGWAAVLGTGLLLALSSHDDWGGDLNYVRPYFAALFVGSVIFCDLAAVRAVFENRVAVYIGKISYALYIYHPLMIHGWMNEGSSAVRYLLKRPVSFALTWAAAHGSTFLWEARWQKLARGLAEKYRARGRYRAELSG